MICNKTSQNLHFKKHILIGIYIQPIISQNRVKEYSKIKPTSFIFLLFPTSHLISCVKNSCRRMIFYFICLYFWCFFYYYFRSSLHHSIPYITIHVCTDTNIHLPIDNPTRSRHSYTHRLPWLTPINKK